MSTDPHVSTDDGAVTLSMSVPDAELVTQCLGIALRHAAEHGDLEARLAVNRIRHLLRTELEYHYDN
jgi:hypothetical protein